MCNCRTFWLITVVLLATPRLSFLLLGIILVEPSNFALLNKVSQFQVSFFLTCKSHDCLLKRFSALYQYHLSLIWVSPEAADKPVPSPPILPIAFMVCRMISSSRTKCSTNAVSSVTVNDRSASHWLYVQFLRIIADSQNLHMKHFTQAQVWVCYAVHWVTHIARLAMQRTLDHQLFKIRWLLRAVSPWQIFLILIAKDCTCLVQHISCLLLSVHKYDLARPPFAIIRPIQLKPLLLKTFVNLWHFEHHLLLWSFLPCRRLPNKLVKSMKMRTFVEGRGGSVLKCVNRFRTINLISSRSWSRHSTEEGSLVYSFDNSVPFERDRDMPKRFVSLCLECIGIDSYSCTHTAH